MKASERMQRYFGMIRSTVQEAHSLASDARKKSLDPENKVEVALAENMAERVVGLISVVAPQIVDSGVTERIIELEKEYGALDWRVALKIAEEIAQEKFCRFDSQKEAMEVGIRTGFAYSTVGVVSSPLDGLMNIEFKQRLDGKGEYLCVKYAGPIRNAGGTNAALSVLIADYVRKKMGYAVYDATEEEQKRCHTEVMDYHEKCSPRQYVPSEEEHIFLLQHMPVEVSADPSERFEVSNYKDLPRVPTNLIRSGFCLIMTDCIPLKAPKLWKQLSKWGKDFDMEQWDFLEQYLDIQKKNKSKGVKKEGGGLEPDYTFIKDLVAGRPVYSYPLASGGFRLRYGRCRIAGLSSACISSATMGVLDDFIATGTQLKTERPGKATSVSTCSTIEGPVVKTEDGSVYRVETLEQARALKNIVEILYLGDILVCYGDFLNRAHKLVPAGYCEEWWVQELEKAGCEEKVDPFKVDVDKAIDLCKAYGVSMHPRFTYFWKELSGDQFLSLCKWLRAAVLEEGCLVLHMDSAKRALELAGVPHKVVGEKVVVPKEDSAALKFQMDWTRDFEVRKDGLECLRLITSLPVRDKSGTFVGARMGRPEKAKQRELTGSPHTLFPVGEEGGRMRSLNTAMDAGSVTADFSAYKCEFCDAVTVFPLCEKCYKPTVAQDEVLKRHKVNIKSIMSRWLNFLELKAYPDLVKGVRGTTNERHIPENPAKGILRAMNSIHTNKDGTTRYDMTEMAMTHFKPQEIGTSVERLKELGYDNDIHGEPLEREDQVVELLPQDIVLPDFEGHDHEGAHSVLFRIANFIDELLVRFYRLKPYYNLKSPRDLVGHLVMALAPHTSAAIACRIVGFSQTQGFFAHPYIHSATRRDCDGDESGVLLLMDAFLNFSKHFLPNKNGGTMDAPLVLTSILLPTEVDDMAFDVDIAWKYPLDLYEAALEMKMPWDVPVRQIKQVLGTQDQYENQGFTHDTDSINNTVTFSAYKTLPSMKDKLWGQMALSERIRAVKAADVAALVIDKHFMKDTKGNLRKFSQQEFRCVNCNTKFRRPPLSGKCNTCTRGKILFTINEGGIVKYLEPMVSLVTKYEVPPYLRQTVELLQQRVEGVFGREKEKQSGLGDWF